MITIREYIEGKAGLKISAYGTSQGVQREWDTRKRGETLPTSSLVPKGEWPDRDKAGYNVLQSPVPPNAARELPIDDAREKTPQNW